MKEKGSGTPSEAFSEQLSKFVALQTLILQ